MFRTMASAAFQDILLEISETQESIFYLDNCMSHKGAINENYGRELLELFSMGGAWTGIPTTRR